MHTHPPQGFCDSFGAISWSLFVVRWLRSVMNLLCLLSEDVKKYTLLSLSKACHSNPGAMPPTPISSSVHGTPKAGQCSGAGHRSAPATPLAKTTPTSERPSGAGHRARPGQAAAPNDGAGNSTGTADAANKRQEAQRRGQIFLAATCYTGKGIVIDGVLHLFDVNPPSHCLVDRDVLKQSSKVSPGDGDFMVYVHTPEWNHQIPQLLKVIARDVMPSNKQGTLFKLSHIENWAGLTQGCLVVDKYTAIIRPWVEHTAWVKHRHCGTLYIRGPKSVDEIYKWWPTLAAAVSGQNGGGGGCGCVKLVKGWHNIWMVVSPFRKGDAPPYQGKGWSVFVPGECFQCGRSGHVTRKCPLRDRHGCRVCGKMSHTQELCPFRAKKDMTVTKSSACLQQAQKLIQRMETLQPTKPLPEPLASIITQLDRAVRQLAKDPLYNPQAGKRAKAWQQPTIEQFATSTGGNQPPQKRHNHGDHLNQTTLAHAAAPAAAAAHRAPGWNPPTR